MGNMWSDGAVVVLGVAAGAVSGLLCLVEVDYLLLYLKEFGVV